MAKTFDDKKIIYTMDRVSRSYGTKVVLKDISISYYYGAKIGVVGANGSGKSSLFKILAGRDKDFVGETTLLPGYTIGYLEQELPQSLIDEIQSILCGKAWVIFATNAKTGKGFFEGLYCDTIEEEWNDMERLHKTLAKIRKPKSLWRKLIGRSDVYEIFNWQNYERVIK